MIAASIREGDDVVDMLLSKEADANERSGFSSMPKLTGKNENNDRHSHADFSHLWRVQTTADRSDSSPEYFLTASCKPGS